MLVAPGTAGYHLAAGDAYMNRQLSAAAVMEQADLAVNFESGSHCPQRVIVMGNRSAKQSHDIIAHVLVDCAAKVRNDGVNRLEIAIEQRMDVLRSQLGSKPGKAHDIRKQHRDLPVLAGSGWRLGWSRRVAQKMASQSIGSVVVVDGDKVIGIFTAVDACRALADALA
jgi:hypothetical protein